MYLSTYFPEHNKMPTIYEDFKSNYLKTSLLIKLGYKSASSRRNCIIFKPIPKEFWLSEQNPNNIFDNSIKNLVDFAKIQKIIATYSLQKLFSTLNISTNDEEFIENLGNEIDIELRKGILILLKIFVSNDKIDDVLNLSFELQFPRTNANKFGKYIDANDNMQKIVIEQYEIIYKPEIQNKFRSSKIEFSYLYHGSSIENWYSILHNGLKVCSNTSLMTAGAAYGPGIYLSSDFNYSLQYCRGNNVIAAVEVLGDKGQYKKAPSIFVAPEETQALIKYLIVIDGNIAQNYNLLRQIGQYIGKQLESKKEAISKRENRLASKANMIIEKKMKEAIEKYPNDIVCIDEDEKTFILLNKGQIMFPDRFPHAAPYLVSDNNNYLEINKQVSEQWKPTMKMSEWINYYL